MKTIHSEKRRRGFTLMEVLLVLAIMGVIMAMVVPKVLGRQQHANADATRVSISGLTQALKLYSLDHSGEFPLTNEGLQVLMTSPGAKDTRWRGPYLEQQPLDAWGSTFEYLSPGKKNSESFDLISPGPDRTIGTSDDIGNWEET